MIYPSVDSAGNVHSLSVVEQTTIADRSSTIGSTGVSQPLMMPNPARCGWLVQNRGDYAMTVSEIGADATLAGAIQVAPGEIFPPPGYPISLTEITIAGHVGDAYSAREW